MKKENKNISVFITIWKWIHIFIIIQGTILFIASLLKKQYILKESWSSLPFNVPFLSIILIDISIFIFSILIVYSIVKRRKIWHYFSFIVIGYLIIKGILIQIILLIKSVPISHSISNIVVIVVYIWIGYLIYKNKDNFERIPEKKKNPWIAAILNLIPGLGYLYLGKRKVFSYLLLLTLLTLFLGLDQLPNTIPSYTPLAFIATVLMFLPFMYDAFYEARNNNKTSISKKNKGRNPWIAAILNIIPGIGYLYLGRRKVFSYLLLLFFLISSIENFINPWQEIFNSPVYWIASILVFFAFMYDAFTEAKG